MPNSYIKKLVDKGKGSEKELEKKWEKAKKLASDENHKDEYDYIMSIFKRMIGESIRKRDSKMKTFKEYISEAPKSGDKEAYKKFFNNTLKKFGVDSPDELEGEKEKEFYDYIDKNWKSNDENS